LVSKKLPYLPHLETLRLTAALIRADIPQRSADFEPIWQSCKAIHSKGITARNANKMLNRSGKTFWQDESFDHWSRSPAEGQKIRLYIENNPVKAHLVARFQDWRWCSAAP
jgi:hypothetical protein